MAKISSMGVTVEIKDNSPEVKEALANALHRGLVAIGMRAETHAKDVLTEKVYTGDRPWTLTGYLRNSVTYAVAGYPAGTKSYQADTAKDGETAPQTGEYVGDMDGAKDEFVVIGTNVKYALGIEEGTHRKAGAVHFLRKAATEHNDEYKEIMKDSLENA